MKKLSKKHLAWAFLFLSASAFAGDTLRDLLEKYIEKQPPQVITCYAQALVLPVAAPNPHNQIIIATEMLEKGFQTQRIQPYGRIKQGSYYVHGAITSTMLASSIDVAKEKLEAVRTARKVFLTGVNYHTVEESVRVLGCTATQLQ